MHIPQADLALSNPLVREGTVRRRYALILLTLMTLIGAFHAAPASAACTTTAGPTGPTLPSAIFGSGASKESDFPIVGLWHVCLLTDNGQGGTVVYDEGFDMFNAGGTESLNDTIPPPLPPYSSGFICLGAWAAVGPRTYRVRHPFWTADGQGNLMGTGVILEVVTVEDGQRHYSGSYEFITYDLAGAVTSDTKGTLTGERISAG